MSSFLANAALVVFATTETDGLGDTVDVVEAVPVDAVPIPASIIERSRKVFVPESNELRTVRWAVGRVSSAHTAAIAQGNRLLDVKTGRTYIVDEITPGVRSITGGIETTLDLRRVEPMPA